MASDDERETVFNPKRRLCPDGTCIGVIGGDGRCSVCHRSAEGPPSADEAAPDPRASDAPPADDDLEIEPDERDAPGTTFDPHRRLCSDGACIGVVGSNNRCQVCGKPA